ncbi:MAG: FAD-dependent oxidoreductase, partial [Bacteroidia bacterium]
MVKNIIVSGAGPIGALLSLNLAKRGYNVKLLERRADFRSGTLYAGRSINIALSDRGWRGIEQAGITEEICKIAIPMYGRYIHNLDGSTVYMPYGKDQQAIYSVSRAAINITLLNLASQHPAIEVLFNQKTNQLDLSAKRLISEDTQTGLIHEHQADLFFGSDGAFSGSRLSMQLQHDRFEYQQHYIPCAYKELIIPPDIQ